MFKVKLLVTVFIAVLSASALVSASASAAPAEWMLNGKTLLEEGLTSYALATTAAVDEELELVGAGLTWKCKGQLEFVSPEIKMGNIGKATSLIFTNCSSTTVNCKIPTTIGTTPILVEVTLDGPLAVKGIVRPHEGTIFTTLKVTGEGCAAEGNKPLTGDFEVLVPEGQDERTDQLLTVRQAANGLLKFGSSSMSLRGSALLLLASRAAWSFL